MILLFFYIILRYKKQSLRKLVEFIKINRKGDENLMFYKYIIHKIDIDDYKYLISILDYEAMTSEVIREITLPYQHNKCIIDTLVNSGLSKYRFIEVNILPDNSLDIGHCRYIDSCKEIKECANSILCRYPERIKNSVLTDSQIENLIKIKT